MPSYRLLIPLAKSLAAVKFHDELATVAFAVDGSYACWQPSNVRVLWALVVRS
eukprot:SAG11_NODE_594_length_8302_cov_1.386810_5_plen_53_part_00